MTFLGPELPAATATALHKANLRENGNAIRPTPKGAGKVAKVGCGRPHSPFLTSEAQPDHV